MLAFLLFTLKLLIQFPDLDKFVLKASVNLFGRGTFSNLNFLSILALFLLLFLLQSLNKSLLIVVLVLDVLLQLTKLVHQGSDLGHSVVMLKHSFEASPAILVLVFFQVSRTGMALASDELVQ